MHVSFNWGSVPPDPIVTHVHRQHVTITIAHSYCKIFKGQFQKRDATFELLPVVWIRATQDRA